MIFSFLLQDNISELARHFLYIFWSVQVPASYKAMLQM